MTRVASAGFGLFLSLSLLPATTSAQVVSTATLAGVVKDTSGAVLPGVTVEAASPALIEKVRTVVTDAQGQYKLIDLRPGSYTVTFSLVGFSTFKREGIELTANFTASISPELKVGTLEETVTVSGQSPIVDVQNATKQQTLSRAILDSIPTGKSMLGFAALTPAVLSPASSQDVGGGKGEASVRMAVHGAKQDDQKLLQDGMRYNSMTADGTGRIFFFNPAAAQEIVVELGGGGSAEYSTGGVQVNLIPKDGGNRYTGYFFATGTGHSLQSNNQSAELQARGLRTVSGIRALYDINGAAGGPIVRDKLWFHTAHRFWGNTVRVANLFHDSNLDDWIFTPDLNQPVEPKEDDASHSARLTWQAASKHRISLSYDYQHNNLDDNGGTFSSGRTALEASGGPRYTPQLFQITWSYPASNRLLFEAGITRADLLVGLISPRAAIQTVDQLKIQVTEQSTSFTYRSPASINHQPAGQFNERASMSYVTGSHHVKVGFFMLRGSLDTNTTRHPSALSYTFNNQLPVQLTEYASPIRALQTLSPELALYAQDQWTVKRLTVTGGLRYEYIHAFVPASQQPAGLLIDARSFSEVDCVPCWKDLSPRLGAAYDLFGTGRTALKATISRYVGAKGVGDAETYNPVNSSVNNVTRAWSDTNRNYVPDCDLRNPLANGECQQISNLNFGKPNITTRPDPDVESGFGQRPYNWQSSVSIEHELRPGLAVSAGYYRTWYGNFTVTDNLLVGPQDYNPYCITAPADARLGSVSGSQICGLYDITPAKFGLVDNLVTSSSKFGKQTERYSGFDVNASARLSRGGQVSGGFNMGNAISINRGEVGAPAGSRGFVTSAANNCFVVDSPQQLRFCDLQPPYQKRVKVSGSYPLAYGFLASGNFQNLPGPQVRATYSATTQEIAPSLGRPLAGGTRTVAIELMAPFTEFEGRINQIDLRLARNFRLKSGGRIQAMIDVFNVLNANPILQLNTTYGPSWLTPTAILDARLIKLGVQLDF